LVYKLAATSPADSEPERIEPLTAEDITPQGLAAQLTADLEARRHRTPGFARPRPQLACHSRISYIFSSPRYSRSMSSAVGSSATLNASASSASSA
jgi:hypothetical protein